MFDGRNDRRDLFLLPKAHLHLHFTGSMSVPTLRRLAQAEDVEIPERLLDARALDVPANERGWAKFQRSYDLARRVVRSEAAMREVVAQAALDDAAEGSRRLELQVDPTSYAPWVGGLAPALEIASDAAVQASAATGVQVALIVAASRVRHPLDARTLARIAAKHAGDGPGEVVGFGLSNDERSGDTAEWEIAFRIARRAGLAGVPHGGELRGPDHIATVLDHLQPARLGHGVRVAEDPELMRRVVEQGVALEICPMSNVHLGVYQDAADVPLRTLVDAGARVVLGADDPLLFHSRLTDQYAVARDVHGFGDAELAELARSSIRASFAPDADKLAWLAEVDAWLASPAAGNSAPDEHAAA